MRPPMMMPPPTPVPIVNSTRLWATDRSSSSWASASAATVASLSTNTGSDRRSGRMRRSGTSCSGTLTEWRAVPGAKSMTDGTPMPTASVGPAPSMTSASWSMSASELESAVGCSVGSESLWPSSTATETFVPPTSTPMKRCAMYPHLLTPNDPSACRLLSRRMPSSPPADDQSLVERAREGDEDAFAVLVRRYSPMLMRLARMYVPTDALAEDVVQETWVAVLRGLDRFEGRSAFKTWLFRILVNRAKTRGVREHRSIPFASVGGAAEDDDEPTVDPTRFAEQGNWVSPPQRWEDDPEAALRSSEVRRIAEEAIAELPERQRIVITLRDLEGLSSDEVRNALD